MTNPGKPPPQKGKDCLGKKQSSIDPRREEKKRIIEELYRSVTS